MTKEEAILLEIKKRKQKEFAVENYLFDKQLDFVNDPAPFKVAVTSRRSGKTVSCAVDLIDTARKHTDVVCFYITLSRSNAKRIIWPEIKRLCKRFDFDVEFNEADLSAKFDNGSIIYLSGASDKSEIEKFRGLAMKKVYIDECQSFPSFIQDLIDDVLAPALMDHAGSLSLIGTPGPIPVGYFHEAYKSETWNQHHWTFWDNPHIATKSGHTHRDLFNRELKRRGVTKSDPSIQREWFGEWVLDTDSLVFKYNPDSNNFITTPPIDNYIMGIDIGYDDADAICVLGWSDKDKVTYLLEEKVTRHQGLTELVQQIEGYRKKYDISKIVMDTAGLGKKIGEEIIKRYKISIIPAEKQRKLEFIELMNDALRRGELMAPITSRFAQDCMKLEWDMDKSTPDKKRVSSRFHSDICDAVLYAWRESYSYTHDDTAKIAPKYGTNEYWNEEAQKMEEAAEEFFSNQIKDDDFDWGF